MMTKVAWNTLKHAHGPATRVPVQIDELATGASPRQRADAYWTLWDTLVHPGAWFEASAPAVSLLLESVARAPDPGLLFVLAADILGADQLRGWLLDRDAPLAPLEKVAHAAAVAHKEVLLEALGGKDGAVRGAAAMALAMLPELAPESLPRLVKQASADADDIARASALLSLGRLGAGDAPAREAIDAARTVEGRPLVRGAAGVSALRLDAAAHFQSARGELEAWLAYDGQADLPWFRVREWFRGLAYPSATVRALAGLGSHRGAAGVAELTEVMLALGTESQRGSVETQTAKVLLLLGGFSPVVQRGTLVAVALPQDLSAEQAAMAKKLAPTHLLPAGRFGLPASGACRRRWIGLEPAGPLERLVPSRKSGQSLPLWRVWSDNEPNPPELAPLDRWQALAEYAAVSYPNCHRRLDPDGVEAVLAAVPAGEELLARATCLADDLAARASAITRAGERYHPEFTPSALVLLPLVRAGRALEARWDPLAYVGEEKEAREILSAIPAERREAILVDHLAGDISLDTVEHAFGAIELAPTPPVLAALERQLDGLKGDYASEVRKLRKRLATMTGGAPAKPAKSAAAKAEPAKAKAGKGAPAADKAKAKRK